jgi:hypothetical protein
MTKLKISLHFISLMMEKWGERGRKRGGEEGGKWVFYSLIKCMYGTRPAILYAAPY